MGGSPVSSKGVVPGVTDHGLLTGLGDDDHAQYLKERLSAGAAAEIPLHGHGAAGSDPGDADTLDGQQGSYYAQAITIPRPKWGANIAYTIPGVDRQGTTSTLAVPVNAVFYTPILLIRRKTFDRILIEVTTLSVGAEARLGIYNADSDWQPTSLVLDAGTVSIASTGVKTIVINQALTAGAFLLAYLSDGSPAVRTVITNFPNVPIYPGATLTSTVAGPRVAQAYGALPNPGVAWTIVDEAATYGACVFLRESTP